MVDAVSVVKLILSLVVAIKDAVDTVKQNKQDCRKIVARVSTLAADLASLDNDTAATKHKALTSALDGLHQALHKALQVITDCQDGSAVWPWRARVNADELRQANQNIADQVARVTLVASLQTNIVVNTTTRHHSQHRVVQSLPQQEGYLVNSREQEEAAPIPSCSKKFDSSELKVATDNFSEVNVIGESASCTVYKGKLSNGSEVAVKSYSKEQHKAFRKQCEIEERFVAKLLHKNIVKLQGHCSTGGQCCYLVYEYMHNRSLCAYINGDRRGSKLPWQKRFNIIKGIARGVDYLHNHCGQRIIHLDLKLSNILLDHGFTPKISGFGISEMLPESADEGVVGSSMGTCGSQAPEYVHKRSFSVKSDVYSYGILLLELITGMVCDQDVINFVWQSWQQTYYCIDDRLLSDYEGSQIEIERCIYIALLCVEEDPALRPTMSDVLQMLSLKDRNLPCPQKPAYTVTSAL